MRILTHDVPQPSDCCQLCSVCEWYIGEGAPRYLVQEVDSTGQCGCTAGGRMLPARADAGAQFLSRGIRCPDLRGASVVVKCVEGGCLPVCLSIRMSMTQAECNGSCTAAQGAILSRFKSGRTKAGRMRACPVRPATCIAPHKTCKNQLIATLLPLQANSKQISGRH